MASHTCHETWICLQVSTESMLLLLFWRSAGHREGKLSHLTMPRLIRVLPCARLQAHPNVERAARGSCVT